MICARCGKHVFSGEIEVDEKTYHRACVRADYPSLAKQLDKLDPPGFEPDWRRGDTFRLHVGHLFGVIALGRKPSSCVLCDAGIIEHTLKGTIRIQRREEDGRVFLSQSICLGCLSQHATKEKSAAARLHEIGSRILERPGEPEAIAPQLWRKR